MILRQTVNSHPKLETCDIFHMPHLKGENKSYLKKTINKNSCVGRQSKWAKTDPVFDDFELDGKFSPKTRNF